MQGVFDPPSPRPSGPDELGETRFQARESGGAAEYVLPTEVEYFARFRQRTREAPDGEKPLPLPECVQKYMRSKATSISSTAAPIRSSSQK